MEEESGRTGITHEFMIRIQHHELLAEVGPSRIPCIDYLTGISRTPPPFLTSRTIPQDNYPTFSLISTVPFP